MRENLHRFFRAARGAGVHVSPAESIDVMRAAEKVGFAERTILRDTLLLTLAKSEDEKKALGACFDLFFSIAEPERRQANDNQADAGAPGSQSETSGGGGAESQNLGPLAQMLLSQDRNALSAAIANASAAASLSDIRFFTQRGIFSSRILEQMGIARLNEDLEALTAGNPAMAERLATLIERLRENVRDAVSQALLLYGREEAENL